jgi:mono/diheme cytochrome c family protein
MIPLLGARNRSFMIRSAGFLQSLFVAVVACCAMMSTGCERAEPLQWAPGKPVAELPTELQPEINTVVNEKAGTAARPQFVSQGAPSFDAQQKLKHGQAVYMHRCVQCHGVSGDGNGPSAAFLYPRPRDYTRGIYKFTSTPYGGKPRREDLLKTIRRGVHGTSMPSFVLLPKQDIEAVVDYVIVLSQRGELEYQLAMEVKAAEELDKELIPEFVEDVSRRWNEAESTLTQPLSPQPELTAERVALGREAFLTKGCSKCHGEDGRGHTKDNIGNDSWGFPTRAADLTSGMLHGGQEPIDIYRRILNGINGSPMPGFRGALQSEPETIWNLVSYVLHVSNRRREGTAIPAGLIKPYTSAQPVGAMDAPAHGESESAEETQATEAQEAETPAAAEPSESSESTPSVEETPAAAEAPATDPAAATPPADQPVEPTADPAAGSAK